MLSKYCDHLCQPRCTALKLKHINICVSTNDSTYEAKKGLQSICSKQNQVKVSSGIIDLHFCYTKVSVLDHQNDVDIGQLGHEVSGRRVMVVQQKSKMCSHTQVYKLLIQVLVNADVWKHQVLCKLTIYIQSMASESKH